MDKFGPILLIAVAVLVPLIIIGLYKLSVKIKMDKFSKRLIREDADKISEVINTYNKANTNRNHYLDLCESINKIARNKANKELENNPPYIRILFGGCSYDKIKNDLAIECVLNCSKAIGSKHKAFEKYLNDISNRITAETEDLYCQTIIIERPE